MKAGGRARPWPSANSHSTDLPASAGFLTAPLSRWWRSARPAAPSTAARTAPEAVSSPRSTTIRSATAAKVSGPPARRSTSSTVRPMSAVVPASARGHLVAMASTG